MNTNVRPAPKSLFPFSETVGPPKTGKQKPRVREYFRVFAHEGYDDVGQEKLELKAQRTEKSVAEDDARQLSAITGIRHIVRQWFQ